ncbi:MAG: helix-turn-helix domain containing protein [Acidobacteriota bacterium]|nr:helix-turn-helix domain containing protein [Acidobacteriota bacterium]
MKLAAQERKERIQAGYKKLMLAAAERVICRHGYQSATMDEIAREAEFSKATLYKYFKNKGEIFLEIILQYIEEIRSELITISQSKLQPEDKLKEIIHTVVNIQSKKENIARLILQDKSLHDFLHRIFISIKEDKHEFLQAKKFFRAKREEVFGAACKVINEGIEKGRFIQTSSVLIVKYVRAMIEGLVYSRFWEEKRLSAQEETDQMFRLLMEGIATKPLQKGDTK